MSEEEKLIIKTDEPEAAYEAVAGIEGISQGRQSKVQVLKFIETDAFVLYKRMGVGKNLSGAEAQELHDRLRTYRRSLRNAGWNIPKLFNTRIDDSYGESQVISYESFIRGGDGEFLVKNPNEPNYRKWYILRSAIETLAQYDSSSIVVEDVCGRIVHALPHGLDLKMANLVMNPDNILFFIDLFGPKEIERDEDGHVRWVTYNKKLESIGEEPLRAVTATREGAILRLLRLAEANWLASGSIEQDTLRSELPRVLLESGIESDEAKFIVTEVQDNYPWLDELYSERSI